MLLRLLSLPNNAKLYSVHQRISEMPWYYIIWCRDDSSLPWRKSHFSLTIILINTLEAGSHTTALARFWCLFDSIYKNFAATFLMFCRPPAFCHAVVKQKTWWSPRSCKPIIQMSDVILSVWLNWRWQMGNFIPVSFHLSMVMDPSVRDSQWLKGRERVS